MKKILSLLVVAVLMLGMMSMSASAVRDLVYTAQYGSAVIDGVYEDAWQTYGSEWTEIDLPHDGTKDDVATARAKMMHDDNLIYFFVEITDATLANSEDLDLTAMDQFEIYLDEDACKDVAYCEVSYQLGMCLNGEVREGTNAPETGAAANVKEFKVGTSADGYTLEFSVAPFNGIPAPDKAIGLEFMYNNCDEAGTFLGADRWNVDTNAGDTAPWQAPECWGELYCAAYVEPEVEAPVEGDAPVDAETPVTADAGIVVAAVVMAAAAAVVCKKH